MTAVLDVPSAARAVHDEWAALVPPPGGPLERFDPAALAALPEPAHRLLSHSITPGTPLWRSVVLTMHGQVRLGAWRPFTATQILTAGEGFIWAATARAAGLPVSGFDRYSRGTGQMRWRLLGVAPVVTASGPDVTRSAAGRLAGEAVFVPTAFRGATWQASDTPDAAVATWRIGGRDEVVELHVDAAGALRELRMRRWGNPANVPFGGYPFGVAVEAERTFAGVTIPSRLRAGWWWRTDRQADGEFFRAEITDAAFQ